MTAYLLQNSGAEVSDRHVTLGVAVTPGGGGRDVIRSVVLVFNIVYLGGRKER